VQQALGEDVPVTLISDALSLREIALRIVRHLQGAGPGDAWGGGVHLAEQHLASVAEAAPLRAEAAE
jgi:hypothetical protein